MKVTLIAHTKFAEHDYDGNLFPQVEGVSWRPELDYVMDVDSLAEFAGRACYQSWNRPNPKTATNEGYLGHILEVGHESVLAHASVSFYVEGVSRSLTHELVRSRFLAYSEISQRFVNMADYHVVIPPVIRDLPPHLLADALEDIADAEQEAKGAYARLVRLLEGRGSTRKQAREAARCVLPGGMETKIVVSGNVRAWRDFIKQRWSAHADAEIREFSGEVLRQLRGIAPNSLSDIPEEPYE